MYLRMSGCGSNPQCEPKRCNIFSNLVAICNFFIKTGLKHEKLLLLDLLQIFNKNISSYTFTNIVSLWVSKTQKKKLKM